MAGQTQKDILKVITSPLGFYTLALLIVEGFLTFTLIFSDLPSQKKFYGMIMGVSLFVIIIIVVTILVWCRPRNLTFGERGHLKKMEWDKNAGTSENPQYPSEILKEKKVKSENNYKK